MGGYVFGLIVSLFLIMGPFILPGALHFEMGGFAKIICLLLGVVALVFITILMVITKLYRKASADEALVRTGMRKMQIVIDGGILFISFLHKIQQISLQTMLIKIKRSGKDALITKDFLRADLDAEFYIKIDANEEAITNASRSLGDKSVNAEEIKSLVGDKLVSALRTVAAKSTLIKLNEDREDFAKAVKDAVKDDLKHNGLTLETVTISSLDQTDVKEMRKDNIFDSQGIQNTAEITQKAIVRTNELVREAEKSIALKDVDTKKKVLETELDQAKYQAGQKRDIAKATAEADKEAQTFTIEQTQLVAQRQVEKERAVEAAQIEAKKKLILTNQEKEVTEVERQKTVQTAQKAQEAAVIAADQTKKVAEVNREKAMEVANREKEIAVKMKEKERADAEAAQLAAEVLKETEAQKVKTVEVVQQAEREKEQQVIKAKAAAETAYVEKQRAADAEAYQLKTVAAGKKEAAEADAFAITRKAQANKDASLMQAEGEKANKLVPVQVNEAQVAVDRKALEQREQFGKAALEFELQKFEIEKTAQVRIESAKAMSTFMNNQKITVFSNPDMMNSMVEQYSNMMGVGQGIQGLYAGLSQDGGDGTEAKAAVDNLLGSGLGLVNAFGEFLKGKGKNFAPEQLKELFEEFLDMQKQLALPPAAPAKPAPEATLKK